MNNTNFGTDMGLSMGLGMWVFWIVLILVVVFLVRLMMNTGSSQSGTSLESPLQILEKRFARGEINKDEFESMKKELDK